MNIRKAIVILLLAVASALLIWPAHEAVAQTIPKISVTVDGSDKPRDVALGLEILFLFTVLSLAPSIMIMMTSFTRIVVVLHFLKQAIGLQQMPPNQLIIGLALFLTFFIMQPVIKEIDTNALQPYLAEKISSKEALEKGIQPLRAFMMKQTREKDLSLFVKFARMERPKSPVDVPTHVLIPAFIISEMRLAFQIGFLIYVPFLMIDMIIASILMSMGMLMLPPMMISLPFKLLLFVLVDGWYLLVSSLVSGVR